MKLILLIGFSKGLGKALFEQLLIGLQPGKRELLALGRNTNALPRSECVKYFEVDLLKNDCWDSLETCIPHDVKSLDVFMNAAVIEPIGAVGTLDHKKIEHAVIVNYISPMKLINNLIFLKNKINFKICVFNISSGASSMAIEGWSLYCSSKAAFKIFLDVTQKENEGTISVTHIDPGAVDTDMQSIIRGKSNIEMKNVDKFIQLKISNSLKSPQEAAAEVLLKSEHSR